MSYCLPCIDLIVASFYTIVLCVDIIVHWVEIIVLCVDFIVSFVQVIVACVVTMPCVDVIVPVFMLKCLVLMS